MAKRTRRTKTNRLREITRDLARTRAIRHPYAGLLPGLPPAELDEIRRFIQERIESNRPYEPTREEQSEAAQAAWHDALRERIQTLEACNRRGRHLTDKAEGKLLPNDLSLVTLACACGAHRRVVIPIDGKPPTEWT